MILKWKFRDRIAEGTSKMRLTGSTRRQYASALNRFKLIALMSKGEMFIHEGKQSISQSGCHCLTEATLKQNEDSMCL